MRRKFMAVVFASMMSTFVFTGCGGGEEVVEQGNSSSNVERVTRPESEQVELKIGMVTDAGTIDDKSFNQGTWEGIVEASDLYGLTHKYLKPVGTTHADYMKEINNFYDAGYNFIVTPGFKFETAIYEAQNKYDDVNFVIIDGAPLDEAGNYIVEDNTVAIYFAEQEAGFLAGIATALQQQTGDVGFIGGMEIPAVQKFNWGFQQGIKYADENLGTDIQMKEENIVYQGSFDNVPAGQQIAAQMYDKGVKTIFCAAGGVGVGAITEAKERAIGGEEVWIVGVDVDQYNDGLYGDIPAEVTDETPGTSVILTSAIKYLGSSTIDMIEAQMAGEFPGGSILTLNVKTDSVGLPEKNYNLSEETMNVVNEIAKKVASGEIVVASTNDGSLIQ
ncbi:BMP family ABC transporter substrate-binding protein [Candidatus Epulonipiscium fishelsonii]|uniref:BMP family ABC transporter substrate-binding protein n=1 Tax=Candidatus Epulonipiscium fishelsonii TaxID=77094 RepID=A0ACC8X962_9FIRM|nr:BMP family ABC transporter substrate-binding protein [Epulopiscium sp. SCG-B11WGA-EpuloA1]ONI42841.1 BMP family ABC transporter substrate-binding protein [Epulopiscium sp. SCG-B05WGA-EpuloA1]